MTAENTPDPAAPDTIVLVHWKPWKPPPMVAEQEKHPDKRPRAWKRL
jgi:hypothetical protein